MPIDSLHPALTSTISSQRTRCRDCFAGSDAVKMYSGSTQYAASPYLSRLPGQKIHSLGGVLIDEYADYLARAVFLPYASRTVDGLLGMLFRRAPAVTAPDEAAEDLENWTLARCPLDGVARMAGREVLTIGAVGLCVDWSEAYDRPFATVIRGDDILSWRTDPVRMNLTRVVIREAITQPIEKDPWADEIITRLRVIELRDGMCVHTLWVRDETRDATWIQVDERVPLRRGAPLAFIPVVYATPMGTTWEIQQPPLLDLVDLNLAHFRDAADYQHGLHFAGLPTAVAAGFPREMELRVGGCSAWVADNPAAHAEYLQTGGSGLAELRQALAEKKAEMAILGARLLLADQKKGVETAEAMEIRMAGDEATLTVIAQSLSELLTQALRWHVWWRGADDVEDVKVEVNEDFVDVHMSADELTKLWALVLDGGLSRESYEWAKARGELVRPGLTVEQEQALADASARAPEPAMPTMPTEPEEEEDDEEEEESEDEEPEDEAA